MGFKEQQTQITAPAHYASIKFAIAKKGTGRAVLAQLDVHTGTDCTAAPVKLTPQALGTACGGAFDFGPGSRVAKRSFRSFRNRISSAAIRSRGRRVPDDGSRAMTICLVWSEDGAPLARAPMRGRDPESLERASCKTLVPAP